MKTRKVPAKKDDTALPPELIGKELVDTKQAAVYLKASPRFLEIGRIKGGDHGPKFVQCSPKMIRYRIQDLDAWIASRIRTSTSDDGSAA